MREVMEERGQMDSHTVGIYRTAATVKGGRRFSFGALVIVGDHSGSIGFGYGKSNEVPSAIEKATKKARSNVVKIPRVGSTVPHEVEGRFGASSVRLIPASPGTGVVAGTTVRSLLEHAGITDCMTKCYGSTNARNVVKAVFDGLSQLQMREQIEELRGVTLGESETEQKVSQGARFAPVAKPRPIKTEDDNQGGRRGGPGRGKPQRGGGGGGGGGGNRRGPGGADARPSEPQSAPPSEGSPK